MSRRTVALLFFGVIALAELGDLAGLVITLGDPAAAAAMLGITPRAETIRAIILLVLAVVIVLNALIALAGVLARQALLVQFGAFMAAAGLGIYGLYQIGSALLQHGQLVYAGVGVIYLVLGQLALWLARSPAAIAAKKT